MKTARITALVRRMKQIGQVCMASYWITKVSGIILAVSGPFVVGLFPSGTSPWVVVVPFAIGGIMLFLLGRTTYQRVVALNANESQQSKPEPAKGSVPTGTITSESQLRAAATLWEYQYLNYHLVDPTQRLLDIVATNGVFEASLLHAISLTANISAAEVNARVNALEQHRLIELRNGAIHITDRGRDYIQWRGPMPPLPPAVQATPTAPTAPPASP